MTYTEFMNFYDKPQNMTYEEFKDFMYNKKHLIINSMSTRIINVDLKQNNLTYIYSEKEKTVDIDNFIYNNLKKFNLYVTNPSILKNWKGFYTNKYIYLNDNIIQTVSNMIPKYLFLDRESNIDIHEVDIQNSLDFLIIPNKNELQSYILRNKLAYECGQLEKHFWYVKKQYNITIISDLPIYTPINSAGLFRNARFTHIDLHNVNFSNTIKFSLCFFECYAKSVNFGKNPNTSKLQYMSNMFAQSHIKIIDLRDWNLENVIDMRYLCHKAKTEELYLNPNTYSLEHMESAISNIPFNCTNIGKIYLKKLKHPQAMISIHPIDLSIPS